MQDSATAAIQINQDSKCKTVLTESTQTSNNGVVSIIPYKGLTKDYTSDVETDVLGKGLDLMSYQNADSVTCPIRTCKLMKVGCLVDYTDDKIEYLA